MPFFISFNKIHILPKFFFSLILGIIIGALFWEGKRRWEMNILIGWDVFCLCSNLLYWITFFKTPTHQIRKEAAILNLRRLWVFFITLFLVVAAIGIVLLLFISKNEDKTMLWFEISVGFSGLMLTWILLHTLFALKYAHNYYAPDKINKGKLHGGLEFPEDNEPNYLDFAYFSFVNGMTFQVSDVSISSKSLRLWVLFQSFIAFCFNTMIVALSINLIASLMN